MKKKVNFFGTQKNKNISNLRPPSLKPPSSSLRPPPPPNKPTVVKTDKKQHVSKVSTNASLIFSNYERTKFKYDFYEAGPVGKEGGH